MLRRRISHLILITALFSLFAATLTAGGQARDRKTKASKPFFVGNFDTCDFSQWNLQGPSAAFKITKDERTQGRCAAVVSVGPASFGSMINQSSDGAAFWTPQASYGTAGHTVWQHFSVMFLGDFKPTEGEWNWFAEWHNDGGYQQFVGKSISWEMPNLCWSIVRRNGSSRVSMRIIGGSSAAPRQRWVTGPKLKTGHWYDFLVRATWSPDAKTGRVGWWLDGRKLFNGNAATLYTRPDGSVSSVYFLQDYYRLHADWTSSVAFDGTILGPSRGAVRYS